MLSWLFAVMPKKPSHENFKRGSRPAHLLPPKNKESYHSKGTCLVSGLSATQPYRSVDSRSLAKNAIDPLPPTRTSSSNNLRFPGEALVGTSEASIRPLAIPATPRLLRHT